ncbi:hypothetical protein GUJ93_ZPchr0001g31239 [Zizania palustris]|uniref:Uncharacterized protein n=1 Tax=Zizania palustris TaxID=103762 RepID=A0A8J5VQF6_ZIZPA|nr:hypothetical protein GUJ93_ZPchr0001g31239 [Zizania palustris]
MIEQILAASSTTLPGRSAPAEMETLKQLRQLERITRLSSPLLVQSGSAPTPTRAKNTKEIRREFVPPASVEVTLFTSSHRNNSSTRGSARFVGSRHDSSEPDVAESPYAPNPPPPSFHWELDRADPRGFAGFSFFQGSMSTESWNLETAAPEPGRAKCAPRAGTEQRARRL